MVTDDFVGDPKPPRSKVTPNASWTKIVSENRWISGLTGLTAGNHALNRLLKVLKSTMKNCFL